MQCAIVIIPDHQTNERVFFEQQDEMVSEEKALGSLDVRHFLPAKNRAKILAVDKEISFKKK